jgi:hypothetical protein
MVCMDRELSWLATVYGVPLVAAKVDRGSARPQSNHHCLTLSGNGILMTVIITQLREYDSSLSMSHGMHGH